MEKKSSAKAPKRSLLTTIGALVIALIVWLVGGDPTKLEGLFALNEPAQSESIITSSAAAQTANGKLEVWYIDVGQGDCELIRFPDGETMLIDAGERENKDKVIAFIRARGIKKLNTVIATHPHSDHIGAMAEVLQAIPADTLYLPDKDATSASYRKMLEAAEKTKMKVKTAKAGVTVKKTDDLCAKLIAPVKITEETSVNSVSAVLKLTYGENTLLFMGDAETDEEQTITEDVRADIIKIGHHCSTTSSGQKFVDAVQAKHGIICCGTGNDYGHPHDKIVKRWKKSGTKLWRTDLQGTIYAQSNGKTYSVAQWKE